MLCTGDSYFKDTDPENDLLNQKHILVSSVTNYFDAVLKLGISTLMHVNTCVVNTNQTLSSQFCRAIIIHSVAYMCILLHLLVGRPGIVRRYRNLEPFQDKHKTWYTGVQK